MKIRKLAVDDQDTILKIVSDASRISNGKDYPLEFIEYLLKNRYNTIWFQSIISKKNRYVVVHDNSIMGIGGLNENEIVNMFVDPKAQRKGAGSHLLNFLRDLGKSQGFYEVYLNSTITAKEFYEKHGFEVEFQRNIEVISYEIISYRMKRDL